MQQGNDPIYSMLKINKTKTGSSLILKSLFFFSNIAWMQSPLGISCLSSDAADQW